MKSNEAVYRGYIHPEARINWTSNEDVMKNFHRLTFWITKGLTKEDCRLFLMEKCGG